MKRLLNGYYDWTDLENYHTIHKDGTQGRNICDAIWAESPVQRSYMSVIEPLYTIYDKSPKFPDLPSARQIYMNCEDPTEYEPAMILVGSWKHWVQCTETVFFRKVIVEWRTELEVKLKSKGFKKLIDLTKADSGSAITAAKYLSDKGWKEKPVGSKRGRPSKEEVKNTRDALALADKDARKDAERVGLKLPTLN